MDRNGNIGKSAIRRFTVDLIAPTVVISSPKRGGGVSGEVVIEGSVFDRSITLDLLEFRLSYAQGKEASVIPEDKWLPIGESQSSAVEDSVLGTWNTEDLPDGDYVLKILAIDKLKHQSVDNVNVVVVSALEQIEEREGGRVASAKGTVELMVPPNGLKGGGEVQIAFVPGAELPAPPTAARMTGIAYALGPEELVFNKRSTLTIGYEPVDISGMEESSLAVFALSGGSWNRLGGTVDASAHKISVGIQEAGTYALFEAADTGGAPGVADVACQPRIISPGGGMYPATTDITFKLGAAADVNVLIYSASGNLVAEVEKGRALNAGLNTVRWDGKDRNGRTVRNGIYIVVIDAGGKTADKTVGVMSR